MFGAALQWNVILLKRGNPYKVCMVIVSEIEGQMNWIIQLTIQTNEDIFGSNKGT